MSRPEDLNQIKLLSELELDDLLRWYRRRPGWKLPFKQSFPGNLTKLTCLGFIDKIGSEIGMEFSELIQILSKQELETVAKKMLIDKKYRLNMDKLKGIFLISYVLSMPLMFSFLSGLLTAFTHS